MPIIPHLVPSKSLSQFTNINVSVQLLDQVFFAYIRLAQK